MTIINIINVNTSFCPFVDIYYISIKAYFYYACRQQEINKKRTQATLIDSERSSESFAENSCERKANSSESYLKCYANDILMYLYLYVLYLYILYLYILFIFIYIYIYYIYIYYCYIYYIYIYILYINNIQSEIYILYIYYIYIINIYIIIIYIYIWARGLWITCGYVVDNLLITCG